MSLLFFIFNIATFIADGQARDKITSVLYPFRFPEVTGTQIVDFKTRGNIELDKQQIPCENCFWPEENFIKRDVNLYYQKRSSEIDQEIYKLSTGRCYHDKVSFEWSLSWSVPQFYTTELSCPPEDLCLVRATWLGNFKWDVELSHIDKKYLKPQKTAIWGSTFDEYNRHVITHSFTSSSQGRLWYRYIVWHDKGSIHIEEHRRCKMLNYTYPFSRNIILDNDQDPKALRWPSIMFGFEDPSPS